MQLPDFSVKGRVALITGAGRGIGLGIAQALAAGGAAVAIQDIDEEVARAEAEKLVAAGGRAIGLGGDITDVGICESLAAETTEALGTIDILVNNASIQKTERFAQYPLEEMRRQVEANLLAPIRLCQLVLPAMQAQRWGRIINIGSIQGLKGNPKAPVYAAGKAALDNLTLGLARMAASDQVTVNCIAPGFFDTLRNADNFETEADKQIQGRKVPIQRLGQPEDCAGLALLLCSAAGAYITGQVIYVDGGLSCR